MYVALYFKLQKESVKIAVKCKRLRFRRRHRLNATA